MKERHILNYSEIVYLELRKVIYLKLRKITKAQISQRKILGAVASRSPSRCSACITFIVFNRIGPIFVSVSIGNAKSGITAKKILLKQFPAMFLHNIHAVINTINN